MEIKYHKDYRSNYMIIHCEELNANSKYQIKMLDANRIDGILPCSVRHINGETYLYYEMSSRQSIQNIYTGRTIDAQQLKMLFEKLELVLEELRSFLLEDRFLVLLPEYIFMNLDTEEMKFIFYPSSTECEDWSLEKLLEYLITVIDYKDQNAVDIAYQAYEEAQRKQIIVKDILDWFSLKETPKQDSAAGRDVLYEENNTSVMTEKEEPSTSEDQEEKIPIQKEMINRKPLMLATGAGIVGVLCMALLSYVRYANYLTDQADMLSLTGIIFSGMVVVLCLGFLSYLLGKRSLSEWKKKEEKEADKAEEKDFFRYEEEPELIQSPKKSNREQTPCVKEYGNTVFIPDMPFSENKLYGLDKGNKYHIDLNQLPCTVGKMAGCADFIMNEDSISRMHTRFTQTNGVIYMRDLNSTNGTFKNGLRLEPNESILIEPGDEIRMGKFRFGYR